MWWMIALVGLAVLGYYGYKQGWFKDDGTGA